MSKATIASKVYTRLLYGFDGELLEEESRPYAGPWARAAEGEEPVGEAETGGDVDVLGTFDYEDSGDEEPDEPVPEPTESEEPEAEAETAPKEPEKKAAKGKKADVKEKEKEPEAAATAPAKEEPKPEPESAKAEPQPEPATPAEPQKSPQEMRDELVGEIESRYSFSEDEAELLQTDPAKVLPKMAARLYVDVYEALYYGTMSQTPQLITALQRQNADVESKVGRFYEAFPELKDPKYGKTLEQVGQIWRGQNPNATEDEAIAGIGNAAMAFLGVQRAAPTEPEEPASEAPKPKMPSTPAAARVGGAQIEQAPVSNDILDTLDFEMPDS